MSSPSPPENIRSELRRLVKASHTRRSEFTPSTPTVWRPESVEDPRTKKPFTPHGAWDFISELLESGHEVEQIVLDKPKGKLGYVLKVPATDSKPRIYIKLQICSGYVYGRSFHYSDY
jgi:hypothetical protein